MKKRLWIKLLIIVFLFCIAFCFTACENNNGASKMFDISCPSKVEAGHRIHITINKAPDTNGHPENYEWVIVGENSVDGFFEYEKVNSEGEIFNYFFIANKPGKVQIKGIYHGENDISSNIVEIDVTGSYINSADDLKLLANSGKTFILSSDIDLSDISEWTPIEGFTGYLLGNGHKISNLTINAINTENVGLFGVLEGNVHNLTVENAYINIRGEKNNVGIIAGVNKGTIKNVFSSGEVSAKYHDYVGGIAGYNENGLIVDCTNNANVWGANYVGGIVGGTQIAQNDSFNGNKNNGTITGEKNVGGISGYLTNFGQTQYSSTYKISNNANTGEVKGETSVGGVFGYVLAGKTQRKYYTDFFYDYIQLTSLKNSGKVIGEGDFVGGIIGSSERLDRLFLCENSADITGENFVGGLVGYTPECNINANDYSNTNTITGRGYVGGFAGYAGVVENAVNDGTIVSTAVVVEDGAAKSYVGGIAGYCNGLVDCINNSDISVSVGQNCYVGGLAGYVCVFESDSVNGNVNNGKVTGKSNVGGIAGYLTNYGHTQYSATYTLSNNVNNGIINGETYVGGLFGAACGGKTQRKYYTDYYYDYIEMTLLNNTAHVSGSGNYVGGLVGFAERLNRISFCENSDDITGGNYVGGFVGYAPGCGINANDFSNTNTITGKGYVGGFAGYAGVIENAINDGTIVSTAVIVEDKMGRSYVGGIAGFCEGLLDCTNNSDISVTVSQSCYVGGLAGYIRVLDNEKVKGNVNNGKIDARESVGGIAGYLTNYGHTQYSATYTISNNENNREVKGMSCVGGLFGTVCGGQTKRNHYSDYYYDYIEITYCTNNGKVLGTSYVGGIVGEYTRLNTDSLIMDTNTTAYGNKLGK